MKRTLSISLAGLLAGTLALGCGGSKSEPAEPVTTTPTPSEPAPEPAPEPEPEPAPPPAPKTATATLQAAPKQKVKGTVTFKEVEGGVEITANIEGLKAGDHGFHVHENGECTPPDFKTAGSHFNPGGHPHGAPDAEHRHEGDMGNLTAGKDGKATLTLVMKGITLAEGPTSVMGKAVIVHEKKDDLKSQPVGNAGGRLACGLIQEDAAQPAQP